MTGTDFEAFIERHRGRHPFAKLPEFEVGRQMYQAWFKALGRHGVLDAAALDAASSRMLVDPARTHLQHFPTLVSYAEEIVRAGRGSDRPKPDLSTREGAEAASRGCERCDGNGLATVWHPAPDRARRIPETVAACCVCALGRWIERNHRERSPEIRRRMVDLADAIAGRGVWRPEPPGLAARDAGDFV